MRHVLLAALLTMGLATPALANIGRVKIASGQAFVVRAGKQIPAAPGLVLMKSDMLVTGADGRIGVTFADNTRFAAGPKSRIAISDFAFDSTTHKGRFVTKVERGSLAVVSGQIAKADKNAMRVRTPTSLLGVRGTRFVVTVG